MKTVAIFIVICTLIQYLLVNIQQPMASVKEINGTDIICNPVTTLFTQAGVDLRDKDWAIHFGLQNDLTDSILKKELLWDTMPFLIFQIMIFYYDYFLFRLAGYIEDKLIKKGRTEFYYFVKTPEGVKIIVDF